MKILDYIFAFGPFFLTTMYYIFDNSQKEYTYDNIVRKMRKKEQIKEKGKATRHTSCSTSQAISRFNKAHNTYKYIYIIVCIILAILTIIIRSKNYSAGVYIAILYYTLYPAYLKYSYARIGTKICLPIIEAICFLIQLTNPVY